MILFVVFCCYFFSKKFKTPFLVFINAATALEIYLGIAISPDKIQVQKIVTYYFMWLLKMKCKIKCKTLCFSLFQRNPEFVNLLALFFLR